LRSSQGSLSADSLRHPQRCSSSLTLGGAQQIMDAAVQKARALRAPGAAIAIVDSGGHTLLVLRLDGTFAAGTDISAGKARTAVHFKRATRQIEDTINQGRVAMTTLPGATSFVPLQGGVPLIVDGAVIGGIGVSGAASAQQDEEIALAGAAALSQPTGSTAIRFSAAEFQSALLRGETGETLLASNRFRINASRRDGPGQAEVHVHDTDIFYVLEGTAEVLTGGELADPRELSPGEIRGFALRGGKSQRIGPGDVLTIPAGQPHWFKSVQGPFRYFVVKTVTVG
jgi:uncharacterized protein GlcG (DUF336 family)/uncharacterized RmlC-like cupin family protein